MSELFTHREAKVLNYIDKFLADLDKDKTDPQITNGDYRLYDEEKFDPAGWLDALRSGTYRQGYGYLCIVTDAEIDQEAVAITNLQCSYCCLGVLLDVTSNGWQNTDEDILYEVDELEDREDNDRWFFQESIHNVFDNGDGTLINGQYAHDMGLFEVAQTVLSGLNDAGASFEEIAFLIEANDCREVTAIADKIRNSNGS